MTEVKVRSSSAVMAVGTAFSRVSGFLRSALLVAALGQALRGDLFNVANTLPNMIYILVAGGVFNAVLVPQLVRSQKSDADGGNAYASRVITLAALVLGAVTIVLIVLTPPLIRLFLPDKYDDPALAAHLQSIIVLTRLCLPQVFFYAMFVLVGQILNARGRFGPMMWAPIANNAVAVLMLCAYLWLYGRAGTDQQQQALSGSQELLLGIGSTLGIVLQLLILLPYLRAAGFRYRPRFDFRDAGLTRTLSLGLWTVLFVVINQLAYVVVVRLASGATATDPLQGTGYTVYANAFLILMVPHSIITVSLATAILPTISGYASEDRLREVGATIASTLRTTLAIVLPIAALLAVLAPDVCNVLYGWGKTDRAGLTAAPTLLLFTPGLVFFTVHYLMLRGFYALEQTRRVFFVQCSIAATNIVLALVLVSRVSAHDTAPALAVAYLGAYAVGSMISYATLQRVLGGLETPALVRFLVRMAVAVALGALAAWLVSSGVSVLLGSLADDPQPLLSAARGGLAGLIGLGVVVIGARFLRIREVTSLTDAAMVRVRRR